jgi:hypothetical protein
VLKPEGEGGKPAHPDARIPSSWNPGTVSASSPRSPPIRSSRKELRLFPAGLWQTRSFFVGPDRNYVIFFAGGYPAGEGGQYRFIDFDLKKV